jgi:hypothetical protein
VLDLSWLWALRTAFSDPPEPLGFFEPPPEFVASLVFALAFALAAEGFALASDDFEGSALDFSPPFA